MIKDVLPYHQLMAPRWLHKHAIITGNYTVYPHYLELAPTTVLGQPEFQLALQVKLVTPDIVRSTDDVTVAVTIAMDTSLANSEDHDPSFGISDGKHFVGFATYDKDNYKDLPPCQHIEGETITGLLQNKRFMEGPLVTSQRYPGEIKLQFRPTEKWGLCHTEQTEGYVNIASYQHQLDITKGLYLQMYHEDDVEKYRIKYIEVDVYVD